MRYMTGRIERELERVLKALENKRRLNIFHLLKERKECSVGEIAEAIKLSFKSTSRHLGVLAGADIVEREQRNLQVFYRIDPDFPRIRKGIISSL